MRNRIALRLCIFLFIASFLFTGTLSGQKTWDGGGGDGNWGTAANWSPDGVPEVTDVVLIPNGVGSGNSDLTITVNGAYSCSSLTMQGGNRNVTLVFDGNSLSVTGAVVIEEASGNADKIIIVGSGTLTCGSVSMTAVNGNNSDSEITITSGLLNVSGDITMNGAAGTGGESENAIRFSGTGGRLFVGGNVSSGGNIFPANGTVDYNGSGSQTVKAGEYFNLTFSGGGTKTLAGPTTIRGGAGTGTFTDGIVLSTDANPLIFSAGSAVAGPPSDASYVDGPVIKIGNTGFTFPTGNGGFYGPIQMLSPGSGAPTDEYQAQYFHSPAPNPGSINTDNMDPNFLDHVSLSEYWVLQRLTGSATAALRITYGARSGGITDPTQLRAVGYNNSQSLWIPVSGAPSGGVFNTPVLNFNDYAYLSIGSLIPENTLPVEFLFFNALARDNRVALTWATATETNNEVFVVERSANGKGFDEIGLEVPGAGDSFERRDYLVYDEAPLPGISYYRLRQVDYDGRYEYSRMVAVDRSKAVEGEVRIWPNPVRDKLTVQLPSVPEQLDLRLFDALGREVTPGPLDKSDQLEIDTGRLPAGTYFLRLEMDGKTVIHRLVVE